MNDRNENQSSESNDVNVNFDEIFDSFELESWGGEDIDMIKLAMISGRCLSSEDANLGISCDK